MPDFSPLRSEADVRHVFVEALRIFTERNAKHKDGWREAGWETLREDMKKKLKRLLRYEGGEDGLDDAIDLINYTVFFIIQAREGVRHDRDEF